LLVSFCSCSSRTQKIAISLQCESKKFSPEVFLIFPQLLRIFNQNFTRLLYVHIYGKLINFIQLPLKWTELCHIKHNHPMSFHFSLTANSTDFITKDEWRPNSPDFNRLDYHVWGAMLQAFHKLHSKPNNSRVKKCTAADLV